MIDEEKLRAARERFYAELGRKPPTSAQQHPALERWRTTPLAGNETFFAMNEARIAAGQNPLKADGTEILPEGEMAPIPLGVTPTGVDDMFADANPRAKQYGR